MSIDGDGVWPEVLDAYERALAQAHEHMTDGEPFTFAFPEELGPLPADLAPRASELLEFAAAIERGVSAAMTKVQEELAATAHTARVRGAWAQRPAPHFIDTTG